MAASAASCDLSTGSSVYDTSEEKTNGLRLVQLLVEGGTAILRKFLYFVYPPENLQVVLNKNEAKLQRLKSKGVIFAIQWEMLFPPSGDPPNAEVHLLLRNICYLKAPSTGWHEMPPHDDDKRKEKSRRGRRIRGLHGEGRKAVFRTQNEIRREPFVRSYISPQSCSPYLREKDTRQA